ncbi:nematode cuticle collagen domain protein, partial [Oesophagostomum dentatum]
MDVDTKIRAFRFVGYAAVSFSTLAILSLCVTLPMIHNYVSHVRGKMNSELYECKNSLMNIWSDVSNLPAPRTGNRTARHAAGYPDTEKMEYPDDSKYADDNKSLRTTRSLRTTSMMTTT